MVSDCVRRGALRAWYQPVLGEEPCVHGISLRKARSHAYKILACVRRGALRAWYQTVLGEEPCVQDISLRKAICIDTHRECLMHGACAGAINRCMHCSALLWWGM